MVYTHFEVNKQLNCSVLVPTSVLNFFLVYNSFSVRFPALFDSFLALFLAFDTLQSFWSYLLIHKLLQMLIIGLH